MADQNAAPAEETLEAPEVEVAASEAAEPVAMEADVAEEADVEAPAAAVESPGDADDDVPVEEMTELPLADAEPKSNDIVYGQVARLVDFGAFVDISAGPGGGTVTGLVHVSEVDTGFVENIYAHLAEGAIVRVKVLSMGEDGKIGLSIKQADPSWEDMSDLDRPRRSTIDKDFDRRLRKFMHNSQSIQGEARRQRRSRLGRERT